MAQTQVCRGVATTITTTNGVTIVIYHNTKVVKWDKDKITLDSGGWRTKTTKNRMNQASNQFGLGFQVYQSKGEWFVSTKDGEMEFEDGMEILRLP